MRPPSPQSSSSLVAAQSVGQYRISRSECVEPYGRILRSSEANTKQRGRPGSSMRHVSTGDLVASA
eukprot:3920021-Rhodomonas_salina.1